MAAKEKTGPAAHGESPGTRLLDALRAGDDLGVLAVCGDATLVSAENMSWSCCGRAEIHEMLAEARRRFPGLTFESSTRHLGFGLVIDEARVQDSTEPDAPGEGATPPPEQRPAGAHAAEPTASATTTASSTADDGSDVHPMWDEPVASKHDVLAVWRERAASMDSGPAPLNMPVRVTVRHDDLQVHEVVLSFPAALLKRALGLPVDPLEMSLSEVQSAFIAPVGAGFTTYALARRELPPPPPPVAPVAEPVQPEPKRRRGRVLAPLLVALVAVIAAGSWWAVLGRGGNAPSAGPASSTTQTTTSSAPTTSPTSSPTSKSTDQPKVTQAQPSNVPSHKPNITLKSDLAFGFNSSTLSAKAKTVIAQVAQQVRDNNLSGTIYVDGYTDNLGSAAYGIELSKRRAFAVSSYLGSQLAGVSSVTIVSTGHGEANPIADNSTAAGRIANRRVTITLPKP